MYRNNKKLMHLCIIIVMIVAIIFSALIIVLKYGQDGETNMPFEITKISVISTVGAKGVDNKSENWNLQASQDNDINIYIQKNDKYTKTETIKNILIDNINIVKNPNIGNIKFYKPSKNKVLMFENNEEYEATQITFDGDKSANIQELKIGNQGGIIAFRCSNQNVGTYTSNKDKEVEYKKLLKKLNINNEDLQAIIKFDITIELDSEKSFKGTYSVDIPIDDIVSKGKTGVEITDFEDTVFKRVEN